MKYNATSIPNSATGVFSALVNDYISGNGTARGYVPYAPDLEGIKKAIQQRKFSAIQRQTLVSVLENQYQILGAVTHEKNKAAFEKVQANISLLKNDNCFAVTTAHQPNLFTGPLYFFYKIIHVIKLASALKAQFPENDFVPVYYMGSEDADLAEVGSYSIDGAQHQWKTKQTGAIGRMLVEDHLLQLLQDLEGYWTVKPEGKATFEIIKAAYKKGNTINEATLEMVHLFFGKQGLVVVQPDDAKLKSLFVEVMQKELTTQFSHAAIQPTLKNLSENYHVQSEGREINLFYLKDAHRNRIEKSGELFSVVDTNIQFTQAEIIKELQTYPDRFSPNVILRGAYQETILPSVVFVGGGGELAYWMELKEVFDQARVNYPVILLRNSFLFINEKQSKQWASLEFNTEALFHSIQDLELAFVKKQSVENLALTEHIASLTNLYNAIQQDVIKIDASLGNHALNLSLQAQKKLALLEKKMVRAEKRKQHTSLARIHSIKSELFPNNNLQERVENFSKWVGDYGWDWVEAILNNSNSVEASFTILQLSKD
ncbi:MAG: bacillithiol biosynthesis cysteine-adding enzyme BshC [Sediminibacterium sp.]|jgi:bacillithiol synthase|nr:bacillithiol biosynthesis cysteine-adding enzyme BshC [Sediminibacterium sp.]